MIRQKRGAGGCGVGVRREWTEVTARRRKAMRSKLQGHD